MPCADDEGPEPQNECGGYYCSEEHGHIDCMTTNQKRLPAFTDIDPMPFGKHKGEPLRDVPARYLQWLWRDMAKDGYAKLREIRPTDPSWVIDKQKLANYIWNSQDALAQETGERL